MLTGSPGAVILAYLAQLPLFAAGLWLGVGAAAAAGLTASAILLAAATSSQRRCSPGFMRRRLSCWCARRCWRAADPEGALQWYPPGLLTGWLAGLGLAALAAALLFFGGPGGIEASLHHVLAPVIDRFVDDSGAARDALTDFSSWSSPESSPLPG